MRWTGKLKPSHFQTGRLMTWTSVLDLIPDLVCNWYRAYTGESGPSPDHYNRLFRWCWLWIKHSNTPCPERPKKKQIILTPMWTFCHVFSMWTRVVPALGFIGPVKPPPENFIFPLVDDSRSFEKGLELSAGAGAGATSYNPNILK